MHRGPAFAFAADEQVARDAGRLGPDRFDLFRVRQRRDHRGRVAVNRAVEQIFGTQLFGARQRDRAQAQQRRHREQPLRRLRQHDDHVVAVPDAEFVQRAGPALRLLGDLGERVLAPRPGGVDEEKPRTVALGQFVQDVAREIEVRGNVPA